MGDIVVFRNGRNERTWVPRAEEDYWIRYWQAGGYPAARWRDYVRWGHYYFPPPSDDVIRDNVSLRPTPRRRTNYRRWHAPDEGY